MGNNYLKNAYYLMVQNDFCNDDFDDALLNLLLIVLKKKHYDVIKTAADIVDDFREIIGFEVPYLPLKNILCLAQKRGYVMDNKTGGYITDYTKINGDCKEAEVIKKQKDINALVKAFSNYLRDEIGIEEISDDEISKRIDNFIDEQGALFYRNSVTYLSDSHDDFLFAKFLSNEKNEQYYDIVDDLIAGRILSELLIHKDEIETPDFSNKEVYLDANIVFCLLEIDEFNRAENYRKLLLSMRENGIKAKVFEHTIKEVEGIIKNSIEWIDNPDYSASRASKATQFFVSNGFSPEQIEEKLSFCRISLEDIGIEIDEMDYPQNSPKTAYAEQDYYDKIKAYYEDNSTDFDEELKRKTIEIDAKSFFYLSAKNNYSYSVVFSNLKHIMITQNTSLAIVAKQLLDNKNNIPFCVTDTFFGALLWKFNPKINTLLSKQKLATFISTAFLPNPGMYDKFYNIIQMAQDNGTLTEEKCKLLKQNKLAAKLLVEKTQGDIELLSEKTATEILTEIETQAYNKGFEEKEKELRPIIEVKDDTIINQNKQIVKTQLESISKDIRACEVRIVDLTKMKDDKEQERELGCKAFIKFVRKISFSLLALLLIPAITLCVLDIKNGTNLFESAFTYVSCLGIIAGIVWMGLTGKKYNDDEFLHNIRDKYIAQYNRTHNCSDETISSIGWQIDEEKTKVQRLNLSKEELVEQCDATKIVK